MYAAPMRVQEAQALEVKGAAIDGAELEELKLEIEKLEVPQKKKIEELNKALPAEK